MGMTEVACSSGSACTSTTLEPSYVLKAMGLDDALVHAAIRFGLGRWTTQDDVDSNRADRDEPSEAPARDVSRL